MSRGHIRCWRENQVHSEFRCLFSVCLQITPISVKFSYCLTCIIQRSKGSLRTNYKKKEENLRNSFLSKVFCHSFSINSQSSVSLYHSAVRLLRLNSPLVNTSIQDAIFPGHITSIITTSFHKHCMNIHQWCIDSEGPSYLLGPFITDKILLNGRCAKREEIKGSKWKLFTLLVIHLYSRR